MELKEVKHAMLNQCRIESAGIEYKCINACLMKLDRENKKFFYSLELLTDSGCVSYVKMEKASVIQKGETNEN